MSDLTVYVARVLNRGPDELMDLALACKGSPAAGPASLARDRLGLLKRLVFAPWRVRSKAVPLHSDIVVFDVGLSEEYQTHRSAFVARHFGERVDFVSASTPRTAKGGGAGWLRWYLFGVRLGFRALFDLSARRYFWLGSLLLEVQALALAAPGIRKAYVFRLFDRRPYLAATFLARRTAAEVVCVFQNIPLWRNSRYFHLEVPVVLTSKVNVPEVEYLREHGMFASREVTYAGGEFGREVTPHPPIADIGYFSSGEWARREGLYQVTDSERVRRGEFLGNAYAEQADWLVRSLAAYARSRQKTLRIYPHPYERRLLRECGIEPPYAGLADGGLVTIDESGADSREKVYEPSAAVSLQSSFIWERLDLGLEDSFIYEFQDAEKNVFKRESLGPYATRVFRDEGELYELLDRALGGPKGRTD